MRLPVGVNGAIVGTQRRDDWRPFRSVLTEVDERAAIASRASITDLGISPEVASSEMHVGEEIADQCRGGDQDVPVEGGCPQFLGGLGREEAGMGRERLADDLGRALAAEDLDGNGLPVHRLKFLIGEAFGRLPLDETLREGRECRTHERHADGVSVSAREHHRNVDAPEAEAAGEAINGIGVDPWREVLRLAVGHGFHRGDIDVLAEAAALGLAQSDEGGRCGVARSLQKALRYPRDPHRGPVLVAAGVQEPAAGHRGQVRTCPSAARSSRAEWRHGRMDDCGIDCGQIVVAEAQRCHLTHRRVLDEGVRTLDEFEQSLAA